MKSNNNAAMINSNNDNMTIGYISVKNLSILLTDMKSNCILAIMK